MRGSSLSGVVYPVSLGDVDDRADSLSNPMTCSLADSHVSIVAVVVRPTTDGAAGVKLPGQTSPCPFE